MFVVTNLETWVFFMRFLKVSSSHLLFEGICRREKKSRYLGGGGGFERKSGFEESQSNSETTTSIPCRIGSPLSMTMFAWDRETSVFYNSLMHGAFSCVGFIIYAANTIFNFGQKWVGKVTWDNLRAAAYNIGFALEYDPLLQPDSIWKGNMLQTKPSDLLHRWSSANRRFSSAHLSMAIPLGKDTVSRRDLWVDHACIL